jgi:hypothetical protein
LIAIVCAPSIAPLGPMTRAQGIVRVVWFIGLLRRLLADKISHMKRAIAASLSYPPLQGG